MQESAVADGVLVIQVEQCGDEENAGFDGQAEESWERGKFFDQPIHAEGAGKGEAIKGTHP